MDLQRHCSPPTLRVDVGDRVRIVLENGLPESTVLHLHGLPNLPNAMDGVPDIIQPPIKPGESFTYEFVADGPAVGVYHTAGHTLVTECSNGQTRRRTRSLGGPSPLFAIPARTAATGETAPQRLLITRLRVRVPRGVLL